MKLTVNYRPVSAGIGGSKHHYLDCHVDFTREERVLIDERGLYDEYVLLPAATPAPTGLDDVKAKAMRIAGIILTPIGLLLFADQLIRPDMMEGSGPFPFLILAAGVALYAIGKFKAMQAARRSYDDTQSLTVKRLLTNPDFIVHAYTMEQAKEYDGQVQGSLGVLAQSIRATADAPAPATHEL
jgi:hypothetical protein